MSKKAFAAGFHTVRVNTRNCGGTEHLTPTLYCAGLSQDVGHVTKHLRENCGTEDIYLAGVSLGANIILKHLGEQGTSAGIQGAAVVSPPIDLALCAQRMLEPQSWIYQRYFVQKLKEHMLRKALHYPAITDLRRLARVRTIYEFDDVVTAPHFGFGTADNYYRLASSAPLLRNIRTPTLLIQAMDDPMVPYEPFQNSGIEENKFLHLLVTQYGGHVGFLGSRPACAADQDAYWAESRVVQFLTMLVKN
jgi:predicted alpha/beta-fold hydrolase